ncbi:alpha/beta fold hydrolase [Flavobacterium sp. JP2137]|uniref:alpha/beta fold hydrolase n=1 Tax=Flavobacterium sp. JP2137 TaxID=3414510 RepID=UPI003D2FF762
MKKLEVYSTRNGGQISYRVYGDETGFPILVHHGLLGSSLLPDSWSVHAKEARLRLLAIDRPGYGESTATGQLKSISDWGAWIAPLLDELKIGDFGTIAVSAGAPYAWAEAWYFKERVKQLWLLSAVPTVFNQKILSHYPREERESYERFKSSSEGEIAQDYYDSLKELQRQFKDTDGVKRRIDAALSNACVGVAREAKMQVSDWGFEAAALGVPMEFWHSPKDDMVPIAAVEAMIAPWPHAILHLQDKKSHFPSKETVDEVFESIKTKLSTRF